MKLKNLALILSLMVMVASCGKSSSGSSAGISPITAKDNDCKIQFKVNDNFQEIAAKAYQMRTECHLNEEAVVSLLTF